jgi:hypothetical protein
MLFLWLAMDYNPPSYASCIAWVTGVLHLQQAAAHSGQQMELEACPQQCVGDFPSSTHIFVKCQGPWSRILLETGSLEE